VGSVRKRFQRGSVEQWEVELVRRLSASFRTRDPAALESELTMALYRLKRSLRRRVEDWPRYLSVALQHAAIDWLDKRRKHELREGSISLNAPLQGEEPETLEDRLAGTESDLDSRIAIEAVLGKCDPWLPAVWKALLQTDGNVTHAAKRLRVHPNTIRLARRRIAELLRSHGFGDRR
jgi:hypothetical protein